MEIYHKDFHKMYVIHLTLSKFPIVIALAQPQLAVVSRAHDGDTTSQTHINPWNNQPFVILAPSQTNTHLIQYGIQYKSSSQSNARTRAVHHRFYALCARLAFIYMNRAPCLEVCASPSLYPALPHLSEWPKSNKHIFCQTASSCPRATGLAVMVTHQLKRVDALWDSVLRRRLASWNKVWCVWHETTIGRFCSVAFGGGWI